MSKINEEVHALAAQLTGQWTRGEVGSTIEALMRRAYSMKNGSKPKVVRMAAEIAFFAIDDLIRATMIADCDRMQLVIDRELSKLEGGVK